MAADEFAVFYAQAYPGAKRLAHLLLGGAPAAEDVVQVAFTRVHDVYADLPAPEDHLRAAVVALAGGGAREAGQVVPPRVHDGPVDIPDPLLDAVAGLPSRQRAAVVLRYWGELPDLAIAAAVGVAPAPSTGSPATPVPRASTSNGTFATPLPTRRRTSACPRPSGSVPGPCRPGGRGAGHCSSVRWPRCSSPRSS